MPNKHIAVLTSGGDAPGMNAAIRAAVRTGIYKGWEMFGVQHGYQGLINGDIIPLKARDVGGIIERGGTILHSARCPEFKTREGQLKGINVLKDNHIDALIVIGGGGSQAGAAKLWELEYPVIGVASTIDNDLYGSDMSIGVNTAINTALESIDKLRVTASSHDRTFMVEVMGRDCGYLALISGITGGADYIIIPEVPVNPEDVASELRSSYQRNKMHAIVVVAEGARYNAEELSKYFHEHQADIGFEIRVTRLGHVQRGGTPTAFDRLLGTSLAAAAIDYLEQDRYGILVGLIDNKLAVTPLIEVTSNKKMLDLSLLKLARILSR